MKTTFHNKAFVWPCRPAGDSPANMVLETFACLSEKLASHLLMGDLNKLIKMRLKTSLMGQIVTRDLLGTKD